MLLESNEPSTYKWVEKRANFKKWQEAKKSEMDAMYEN